MDIEPTPVGIHSIRVAVEFILAWLSIEFNFFNKKNRLNYSESKRSQKHNIKNQITNIFKWFHREFLVHFFAKYGLKLAKIVFIGVNDNPTIADSSTDTVENMKIEFIENEIKKSIQQKIKLYRAKELNNMSDKTYQDFINAGSQFGSLRFARKCRSILNSQFKYKRNNYGVFNDPEEKIKYYLRLQKDNLNIVENTIHIRLAGDGTHIGKNFSVLNFSFSFLNKHSNEEMSVSSVTGIFLLGVFKIKSECYTSLKEALKELVAHLKKIKEIDIDGVKFKIEYWLGGDMNFFLLILGNIFFSHKI